MRPRNSFARRVAIANTKTIRRFFLIRLLFMSTCILHHIGNHIMSFSKVPFAQLGVVAHLDRLYGINTELRDLRRSHVAVLLSIYIHSLRNLDILRTSLHRISTTHY